MIRKYTLYHSCYIDLYRAEGVASYYIESDEILHHRGFIAKENTTINELGLIAILYGLRKLPEGSDVHITGVNRYCDSALKKLASWMRGDGEIDIKAHSELLKAIWPVMVRLNKITSCYYQSRRTDYMLWATSQASRSEFKVVQEQAILDLKFPDTMSWSYDKMVHKKDFLKFTWGMPLTDREVEKRIHARREELLKQQQQANEAPVPVLKLVTSEGGSS